MVDRQTQAVSALTTGDGLGVAIASMGGFATTSSGNSAAETTSSSAVESTGGGSASPDRNSWLMGVIVGASFIALCALCSCSDNWKNRKLQFKIGYL